MQDELTLFELNQFIRRVVALNAPESIWITAEISQANLNKGHYYIDLVQKAEGNDEIIAQSYAVLWSKTYARIASTKTSDLRHILKQGLKVKLRVRVDFHEKYGLKLVIDDIDENFTYGNLALQRAKTIKRLQSEQLIEKNKSIPLPWILKKIAVLSSKTAAGLKDFITHLEDNEYGYAFDIQLFPIAVQGVNTEKTFLAELAKVDWKKFDAVCVIRGGGSKLDLAAFDSYAICSAIAKCAIPVITGIGHEIDETIADMVSNRSLKTPTAVASFILNRNLEVESRVVQMKQDVELLARKQVQSHQVALAQYRSELLGLTRHRLDSAQQTLEHIQQRLTIYSQNKIQQANIKLEQLAQTLSFLSIENTLKRGFTITHNAEGKIITDAKSLVKGDIIETQFHKGKQKSKVQ